MKILFITSRLPFPPIGGDRLRTYHFLKFLNERHEVTLISFTEKDDDENHKNDFLFLFNKIITVKLTKIKSYINTLMGFFSDMPLQVSYYKSEKMKKVIRKELQNNYDVIFSHLIRMSQYIIDDLDILKVVDFTDAISLNYFRSIQYQKGLFYLIYKIEISRLKNYEIREISRADQAIFISDVDASFLRDKSNRSKIKIVQNGVDLEKFKYYAAEYDENSICFLGNMRAFPNRDAVLYFSKDVLPKLKKRIPSIKFYIVGTHPPKDILKLYDGKTVFVTGHVNSVNQYIESSALLIAPMRVGAGVQNKILESLSLGTPVVTTTIGAEGIEPSMVIIADTATLMVEKIVYLIKNPKYRKELSLSGRKYIERVFTWEKALSKLDGVLTSGAQFENKK